MSAPVAQLDRATDSGSVGRAFESRQAYSFIRIENDTLLI